MLKGNSGSSFERQEFDVEDFSVDEWIQRKRQSVPLDVLRDDLGSHLKFLRSSLIELINQDYGQFVNLSSNLVGLDGKIQNIQGPLNKVKGDLQTLLDALNGTLNQLDEQLEERRRLRWIKLELKCLRLANSSLVSAMKSINCIPADVQTEADFAALTLAADELSNAKFLLQRCSDSLILEDSKAQAESISEQILSKLATLLQSCSNSHSNPKTVMYILHIYSELNAENEAEQVFVQRIFKPRCESVLTKKGNFTALLEETESFIQSCPLVRFTGRLKEFPWAGKFNFVGRGVFPQVVTILSKHFPHIWSPAMPDSFHANWKRCEGFVAALEKVLPSVEHLNLFRESQEYKEFLSKWQFPVYFQLRFHTFAMELESTLDDFFAVSVSQDFKFESTRVTIKVINQCWDNERTFISHLSGRLLKASALFASRYLHTIKEKLETKTDIPLETLINLYYDFNMAEAIIVQRLVDKIQAITSSSSDGGSAAEKFTKEFGWDEKRKMIEERVVRLTVEKSVSSMSSVTEVPRLFRRTNRDVPTKHSEYVDAVLSPLQSLKVSITAARIESLWSAVAEEAAEQIIKRYHSQVQEVLTSVQRMEESLKRLKKVKGHMQNASGDSKSLSDDDKIRCQICLDLSRISSEVKGLCPGVATSNLDKLVDINNKVGSKNGA